jgi:GH35 family endo-1,4-beta-xylanase
MELLMNSQLKHRLCTTNLIVRNSDKTPLADSKVTVAQTNHSFLFGNAAFDTVPLANGAYNGAELEKAQQRAERLTDLFNAATLPFYWGQFEPVRGKPRTEELRMAASWCVEHGMTVKGHPLCWHTMTAPWLMDLSNAEILKAQTERIHRDLNDFRGLIQMWDVINEAVIMPIFDKYDNGITRICKQNGRIATIKTMFENARAENPTATFLINDFDTSTSYDILIEGCLAAGVKFDVIGIQSHMHQGYWGLEKTQEILERFSRFNLPIHFTENTLVSGHLMPPEIVDLNDYQVTDWPTTPEGEERQAREVVQHYETLMAHPLVEGITWWDLYDGLWLNAPSGLLRRDGSPKPAYEELLKRVKGEWWLAPTELRTDAHGQVQVTGFAGNYEIEVNGKKQAFSLAKGQEQTETLL